MNESLKKEILNHVFEQFGLLGKKASSFTKKAPLSNDFLLSQKMTFESEGIKYKNNIWASEAKIDDSIVQFIVADLTEKIPEYSLLLQLDSFPPYAMRVSLDPEDSGSVFFKANDGWVEAPVLMQAKILIAIESLVEIYVSWGKNTNPDNIHKDLISFLKFESSSDE